MYLEFGKFSPDIKIGLVSASRNCFPRELSEARTKKLLAELGKIGLDVFVPQAQAGGVCIIESKADADSAARQMSEAGCSAAVLYLGNFSPEIEDANFVRAFKGPVLLLAAAEEDAKSVACSRGDALCGLMSAALAIKKRGLDARVIIPQNPIVCAKRAAEEISRFVKIAKVVKGISGSTLGLFGPRPRDFESCNYNVASLLSIGVEIEELALFDLEAEIDRIKKSDAASAKKIEAEISKTKGVVDPAFAKKLSYYERALLNMRDRLKLSGLATQCWSRQEECSGHVPCFINSRLTQQGFPVACENDAYSLASELICQYASDSMVTMLDINHSIPADMLKKAGFGKIPYEDCVGLFHCGNTPAKLMKNAAVKHQLIMARLMEPGKKPDITRGTMEGDIKASPITVMQLHGQGDGLRAYVCEGAFLDMSSGTFGSTGTAYIPGFMRFYRNRLLGNFHHHAAVAFTHCGGVLFDALKAMGVKEIYTPSAQPYPGENTF